ncbi:MAG: hemolysin family protein [Bdellovibrionota bacterium]
MEEILVILACLCLNSLLAAYEMAFVSVPRHALKKAARDGSKDAQRLLSLRENPERTLSVIQIGITLVGAVSAAVGGAGAVESIVPIFQERLGMSDSAAEFTAIILVVLPITYLSVVIGELVPKSLALRNPLRITLLGARWLFIADRALSPAVAVLEWSTKLLLRLFRSKAPVPPPETTVELEGLPRHHQEAILNLAHIERRRIKDILVPWKNVTRVQLSDAMEDVVPVVFASGHTRLPVVDQGTVTGVLHTKEFLAYRESGGKDWKSIVRPILRVQGQDSILSILRRMQSSRSHMAVVPDGGPEPAGIITLEDISEEIWGDLLDEDENSRIRQVFADRVKTKLKPPRP